MGTAWEEGTGTELLKPGRFETQSTFSTGPLSAKPHECPGDRAQGCVSAATGRVWEGPLQRNVSSFPSPQGPSTALTLPERTPDGLRVAWTLHAHQGLEQTCKCRLIWCLDCHYQRPLVPLSPCCCLSPRLFPGWSACRSVSLQEQSTWQTKKSR